MTPRRGIVVLLWNSFRFSLRTSTVKKCAMNKEKKSELSQFSIIQRESGAAQHVAGRISGVRNVSYFLFHKKGRRPLIGRNGQVFGKDSLRMRVPLIEIRSAYSREPLERKRLPSFLKIIFTCGNRRQVVDCDARGTLSFVKII